MINKCYILLIFSLLLYVINKNFCHLTYNVENDLLNVLYYIVETIIMNLISFSIFMIYKSRKFCNFIIKYLFLELFIISLIETIYTIIVYCKIIKFVDSNISFYVIIINFSTFIIYIFSMIIIKNIKK